MTKKIILGFSLLCLLDSLILPVPLLFAHAPASLESPSLYPAFMQASRGEYEGVEDPCAETTPDYPRAHWIPAANSNYTEADRERDGNKIQYIIIHTTQGSYNGTINWFQNSSAKVSSHYIVRSRDGEITQMVQNKDIAWHAGNRDYNVHSIGIEHEGYVSDPDWYTDAMYRASAKLTRWLCDRYGIPKTRKHIIGHDQVPSSDHTDPGKHWDWKTYMRLVNQESEITMIANEPPGRVASSGHCKSN
ncbi:N-acetylmuramoyl-L-alanine amidase [Laceyella putida]|uniref:N-acetylmuramoyl-L-alanine amidase n=1 Tax=Laceyella putida TaxID=110101 RepID=A0ABW2RG52_9BACL